MFSVISQHFCHTPKEKRYLPVALFVVSLSILTRLGPSEALFVVDVERRLGLLARLIGIGGRGSTEAESLILETDFIEQVNFVSRKPNQQLKLVPIRIS